MGDWRIVEGDCREVLRSLDAGSVHTCVTSPPYFGLRDYGTAEWQGGDPGCDHLTPPSFAKTTLGTASGGNAMSPEARARFAEGQRTPYRGSCPRCGATRVDQQLGLEPTPDAFVASLVEVFREVRRVLRDDGTVWLNLGDSYCSTDKWGGGVGGNNGKHTAADDGEIPSWAVRRRIDPMPGVKPKDLLGIPWAVAQALRAPYYGGEIAVERDRVWLAATLDAEGSISGFTHVRADDGSTRTGVHVTITNTVERLLNEADRIWPASRVEHENHGEGHYGSRPSWRWVAHGAERKALLMRELYPYLIAKREQARLAYAFFLLSIDAKRLGHSPQRDATRERRAWIVDALSRLNRGEDVDVPTWIGEPPTVEEPGWYLRSDIIWSKPNPMPESVTDRPTKAHEYVFLLSKGPRYFYDADAIREAADPASMNSERPETTGAAIKEAYGYNGIARTTPQGRTCGVHESGGRNKRSVWTVATQPYAGAHFATFPPKLIEPCILAGAPERACGECGAPWVRVVERERLHADGSPVVGAMRDGDVMTAHPTGRRNDVQPSVTTLGFEPSCSHADGAAAGVVLDPFAGAGTTGMVTLQHRRSFIGIELSPVYAQMARDRIADHLDPLGRHMQRIGQGDLFGAA